MKKRHTKTGTVLIASSALLLVGFAVGGWYLRSSTVLWGLSDEGDRPLFLTPSAGWVIVKTPESPLPWDQPDLSLAWRDAWSSAGPRPLVEPVSGAIPSDLVAYELFGLIVPSSQPLPTDFRAWSLALEQAKSKGATLAAAGRTDVELLNLILWFADSVLGPEALADSFAGLAADPSATVDDSGALVANHPWAPVVAEMKRWQLSGKLIENWWDYSDADVKQAVVSGKAQWGLTWTSSHFSSDGTGVQPTSFGLVPAWPDRRSFTLLGRWLTVQEEKGWGESARVREAKAQFSSTERSQFWLASRGLLTADPKVPAVNQESKRIAGGLYSAGYLVSAPRLGTDLTRWQSLLNAIRTTLRKVN